MITEHDRIVLTAPVPREHWEIGDVGTVVQVIVEIPSRPNTLQAKAAGMFHLSKDVARPHQCAAFRRQAASTEAIESRRSGKSIRSSL